VSMKRMTCGNGGIGLGIALGLAEADSVRLIERRLIYSTGETQNSPESVRNRCESWGSPRFRISV
jgi:hypothetical protein